MIVSYEPPGRPSSIMRWAFAIFAFATFFSAAAVNAEEALPQFFLKSGETFELRNVFFTHSRIWERAHREILICNPLDARWQFAIGLDEFFHGSPGDRVGDEQTNRQRRVVGAANPFP